MTGIVVYCKKYHGGDFFILGEDGIEYFGHRKLLENEKQYDHFCWEGNRCSFTPEAHMEGQKRPRALNIIMDQTPDPKRADRAERRAEQKRIAEENAKRKAEKKRINAIKQADEERFRAYMGDHLKYTVQIFDKPDWIDYTPDGIRTLFSTSREAREKVKILRTECGGMWRVKRVIVP